MTNSSQGGIIETVTLKQLCKLSGVHAEWIIDLVEHGILEPEGATVPEWRFTSSSISLSAREWRLQRDLGVNLPGVALAFSLIEKQKRWERELLFARGGSSDDGG